MIDVKVNRGKVTGNINGDFQELFADTMTLIGAIYGSIANEDKILAYIFQRQITEEIANKHMPFESYEKYHAKAVPKGVKNED